MISVIIAARNAAGTVGRALLSALRQESVNLEVIALDDGSSDATGHVLARHGDADGRVKIITRNCRTGRSAARNAALAVARGEYAAILDADDVMLPGRLKEQAAFLDGNPAVGVLGTAVIYDDGGDRRIFAAPEGDGEIRRRLFSGENALVNSSLMMRRSILESVGGYRTSPLSPEYNEDYLTMIACAERTRFAALPAPLTLASAGGLTGGSTIRAKLREKMRLELRFFFRRPSVRRLCRIATGTAVAHLFTDGMAGKLYGARLRRWPRYDGGGEIDEWIDRLDRERREIERISEGAES